MKKSFILILSVITCLFCTCAIGFGCGGTDGAKNNANTSEQITDKNPADDGNNDDAGNESNQDESNTETTTYQLNTLKADATTSLDDSVNAMRNKITDAELLNRINAFYRQAKASIDAVTDINDAKAVLDRIKAETIAFVSDTIAAQLTNLKAVALEELNDLVATGLAKVPDGELKQQLNAFYQQEKAKINAVEKIEDVAPVLKEVTEDVNDYIKQLVASTIAELRTTVKGYFNAVNESFNASPYDFIPETMVAGYSTNLVTESEVSYDFSGFVNVSNIKYGGFGKQWNMVTDNITQSEYFYKYLNAGNAILSSAITTVTEYLDSDDAETLTKSFNTERFSASIAYENQTFSYSVQYKTGISIPLFGSVTPAISMIYDTVSGEKIYTISLSDTNRLRFSVTENKYEFGIEYGITAASRTSYLIIEKKNDNTVEGHIYEYITLKGKDVMPSCADFYINDTYVSVVGNKADAMMGTKGYINELYKVNEGKLLGYEVRETISSVNYNTLWFNLSNVSGITSIKIGDKTDANNSGKSTNDVYLNGSDTLLSPTYNKKFGVKTSRKYDIEFRTQYFYGKNAETGEIIEYEVNVPMIFIQEDNDTDTNYSDYPNDILRDNGITSSVTLNSAVFNKILADYDALIDDFIENKKMMSSTEIKAYVENQS